MKISIDTREKKPGKLIKHLEDLGHDVEEKFLESGDMYCSTAGLLIERKTVSDLFGSFLSGRLGEQLSNLVEQKVAHKVLLIEGVFSRNWYNSTVKSYSGLKRPIYISPKALTSFLFASQRAGVHVIYTTRVEDTAHTIDALIKYLTKKKTHKEVILVPKAKTLREKQIRAICSFEGVSTSHAIDLLKHFGSVRKVFNSVDDWVSVKGIGAKTVNKAVVLLDSKLANKKKKRKVKK